MDGPRGVARALESPVRPTEHLYLAMLHNSGCGPWHRYSGLVNIARAEAAVRGVLDSPGSSPRLLPGFGALRSMVPGAAMGTSDLWSAVEVAVESAIPASASITGCSQ